MIRHKKTDILAKSAATVLALLLGIGLASAQATDKDKSFVKNTAQDTNFEIRTGRLALKKSPSADVKSYATMVIHDHTQLKQVIAAADGAAGIQPIPPDSMGAEDDTRYAELKVLTGKAFDDAYIKGLVKGNAESVQKEQDELHATSVTAVKQLARRSLEDDTKHTEKAKQLATDHHIQP